MKKNIKDVSVQKMNVGEKAYIQILLSPTEMPNFAMRKMIIEKGGFIPMHSNLVEHEQYYLSGEAEIELNDEKLTVKQGDFIYMPAGSKHSYRNIGEKNFEFLCIVPNKEDKVSIF